MTFVASNSFTHFQEKNVRAADAKEVGVGNPAEETYRYPNKSFFSTCNSRTGTKFVNLLNRAAILLHVAESSTDYFSILRAGLLLSSIGISHLKARCVTGLMCSFWR
jgi:hypothetical protein